MMGLAYFFKGRNGREISKYYRAKEDETSLGNILLELGYLSQEDLEKAIAIQKSQLLLGSILVNMETITEEQLEEALLEQKVRRKSASDRDVIDANSRRHSRLVGEIQNRVLSLCQKYVAVDKE